MDWSAAFQFFLILLVTAGLSALIAYLSIKARLINMGRALKKTKDDYRHCRENCRRLEEDLRGIHRDLEQQRESISAMSPDQQGDLA